MNFKDFGIREWLVIIFIVVGDIFTDNTLFFFFKQKTAYEMPK